MLPKNPTIKYTAVCSQARWQARGYAGSNKNNKWKVFWGVRDVNTRSLNQRHNKLLIQFFWPFFSVPFAFFFFFVSFVILALNLSQLRTTGCCQKTIAKIIIWYLVIKSSLAFVQHTPSVKNIMQSRSERIYMFIVCFYIDSIRSSAWAGKCSILWYFFFSFFHQHNIL